MRSPATGHHFRFIQLPFNLAMLEAYGLANQTLGRRTCRAHGRRAIGNCRGGERHAVPGTADRGLAALHRQVFGMKSDGENAIQFARSAPGYHDIIDRNGKHTARAANMKPALLQPARLEEWQRLFPSREA